jgi:hypothetical protein
VIGLFEPGGERRFHFVAMPDLDQVRQPGLRAPHDAPDLGSVHGTAEKHTDFEKAPLRTNEEVAGLARKHDRVVRRVDSLLAEGRRALTQPLVRVLEILGQIRRERALRRSPAVVRLAFLYQLLAVVTLSRGHKFIAKIANIANIANIRNSSIGGRTLRQIVGNRVDLGNSGNRGNR